MNWEPILRLKDNPYFRHSQTQRAFALNLKPDLEQKIELQGMCREALNFVAREQLMDRALWAKFVEQYRLKSDTNKQEWAWRILGKNDAWRSVRIQCNEGS